MAGFFIEFRIHGYAIEYAKEVISSVARKFQARGVTRNRVVPHISLYGPGNTGDIRKVISAVKKVGRKYSIVPFKVSGFGYFNKTPKVIYLSISPSQQLNNLRWELSQELRKVSTCQPWDNQRSHSFHATIAFKDIDTKFKQIWSYLNSKEKPNINQHLLRITVIGARRRIVCEYDLVLGKLLNRKEALSKFWWRKTINRLGELQGLPVEQSLSWIQQIKKALGLNY